MEEKTIIKLTSNSPVIDDETYSLEVDSLNEKVNDKDVYNIGIVAPYGAGKSSLIKTYKNKYWKGFFKEKKFTSISLAAFNENKEEKTDNNRAKINDINSEIEKSILEQLLFKVGKKTVPHSQINRISGKHFLNAFLTALLFSLTVSFVTLSILALNNGLPNLKDHLYIFACVSVLSLTGLLTIILYASRLSRISVKDSTEENNYGFIIY